MAYAAVITYYPIKFLGTDPTKPTEGVVVKIAETESAAGMNTAFSVPRVGRIIRVDWQHVAGAGTTLQPYANVLMPDGVTTNVAWGTYSAKHDGSDFAIACYMAVAEQLVHFARPDAGADNTVLTWYYIMRDWPL